MLRWVEVNLGNIASNIRYIRSLVGKRVKIIAVVKADAYGHGSVPVSRVLIKNGADILAVANIDEALELREGGILCPILLLNYTEHNRLKDLLKNRITQTIFDIDSARALSTAAEKMNRIATVHIKVDTGMGRLGILPEDVVKYVKKILNFSGLKIEGILSHLSSAAEDYTYTLQQFKKFKAVLEELKKAGIEIPVQHIANSTAILAYPQMHLNAVRPGIVIYGVSPWGLKRKCRFLRPAMSFKTKIVSLKEVPEGTGISYGRTFITGRRSVIADIPIGYAQGYDRNLSNKAEVLVKGRRVPLIGRVCMDQCLVDVTDVPGVKVGDEVVLFGRQGREEISVEELAGWTGTIGYEVVATVGRLVPRIYR